MRRQRIGLKQIFRCATKEHITTQTTGFRTDVHDPVRLAHHLLVVLHYDDGVIHIAQLLEAVDETLVIALMQTDGRLVEDVEHIHQTATDLRSQTYALALTARERLARTVQREITQSDRLHEPKPGDDLFENRFRDRLLFGT